MKTYYTSMNAEAERTFDQATESCIQMLQRAIARGKQDLANDIRETLRLHNVEIEETPHGIKWRRRAPDERPAG